MAEWYRQETTFDAFIAETLDFVRLFLGPYPSRFLTYREAFLTYAHFDYVTADVAFLLETLNKREILLSNQETWDKDALLNLFMSFIIEPHLGKEELCVLTDFPASQAALAQTKQKQEEQVAERFEIYHRGIELANGYHELTDPLEQKKRFLETNQKRQTNGKEALPIDAHFLKALEQGLPDCYGVAAGFDRLLLLKQDADTLATILPFPWPVA